MADKSTIYKVDLHVSDMDRNYHDQHSLTLAKHPSENENRLMVRLLAFALYANESLLFGKGVSTKEEPTLWIKDLTGAIKLWIDIGQPDPKAIKKACGRSDEVIVILYGRSSEAWWKNNSSDCSKRNNLKVIQIPEKATQALTPMAERNMEMTCNIADGEVTIFSGDESFSFEPITIYP